MYKILSVIIQMKVIEHHFPVVLFIMLYKAVLTFESVDEILECDHSNESYFLFPFFVTFTRQRGISTGLLPL